MKVRAVKNIYGAVPMKTGEVRDITEAQAKALQGLVTELEPRKKRGKRVKGNA